MLKAKSVPAAHGDCSRRSFDVSISLWSSSAPHSSLVCCCIACAPPRRQIPASAAAATQQISSFLIRYLSGVDDVCTKCKNTAAAQTRALPPVSRHHCPAEWRPAAPCRRAPQMARRVRLVVVVEVPVFSLRSPQIGQPKSVEGTCQCTLVVTTIHH